MSNGEDMEEYSTMESFLKLDEEELSGIGDMVEIYEILKEHGGYFSKPQEWDEQSEEDNNKVFEGEYSYFLIAVGTYMTAKGDFPTDKYKELTQDLLNSGVGNTETKEFKTYKEILLEIAKIRGYRLITINENLHQLIKE